MNSYEGMIILKPDLAKENLDKVLTQIKDIFDKNKSSVDELKEWSKQNLTFPIKKYKEGLYYLANFHVDPSAISKIRKSFGLNESILRVLLIKK